MKLSYEEFLNTVKVVRMLYGVTAAQDVFIEGLKKYNLSMDSFRDNMDSTIEINKEG